MNSLIKKSKKKSNGRKPYRKRENENGMVSVVVAVAMLVIVTISAYLMQFSAGLAQQERIRNAADLGALAAATLHVQGYSDTESCGAASRIITALPDHAQMQCISQGNNMKVSVSAGGVFSWLSPDVHASAVAGPAE